MMLLFSVFVTVLSYWKIFYGYFQQDEWLSFSYNHFISGDFFRVISQCFAPSVGHFQPFNTLFLYLATNLFKINYFPYALLTIILHVSNVVLVYYLASKIFKNNILSFVTSMFFATNSNIHQATSWVMADTGIHLSTFFALSSLILFLDFISKDQFKHFVVSIVLLFVSLMFKETAVAFFVFYPLIYFILRDTKLKRDYRFPVLIILLGGVYVLFRASMIFIPTAYSNSNSLVINSQSNFHLFYNFMTVPLKAFVQSLIPESLLINLGKSLAVLFPVSVRGEVGTTRFDEFILKRMVEMISIASFSLFGLLLTIFSIKSKNRLAKKVVYALVLFVLLNSFIYALTPEQTGIMSIVASRNLYFISIGTSLLLVYILRKYYFIIFIFIGINIMLLNTHLDYLVKNSKNRQQILNQILKDNLVIQNKQIFYIESDTSYYGLPNDVRILPFQSGFGQTLLIVFSGQKYFPKEFYKGQFLWDLKSQEYKEIGGVGFGYFRDYGLLSDALKEYNLPVESVIAYSWNGKEEKLTNISSDIRLKLKSDKK